MIPAIKTAIGAVQARWPAIAIAVLTIAATIFLPSSGIAASHDGRPSFALPLDCDMGSVCAVQHYIDYDPGPGARDHTCGTTTYNGHKGIDMRLPTYALMRQGVAVIAAAPGIVKATRDGMRDVALKDSELGTVKGREAGNAVIVDHGNGWVSQYSHMRRGSIAVKKGQKIKIGDKLGLVGLSGKTQFPHLHFGVRYRGKTLDPFTGLEPGSGCGNNGSSLWNVAAQAALAYRVGGPLDFGFSSEKPNYRQALTGDYDQTIFAADSPVLIFWALSWGLRKDDQETIRVIGPDGRIFVKDNFTVPKNKAQWFRSIGKRRKARAWPTGIYRGEYLVRRKTESGMETVIDITREIEVR